jgi:hypothetical protein
MKALWSIVGCEDGSAIITYRCPVCNEMSHSIVIIFPTNMLCCATCSTWNVFNPVGVERVKSLSEYSKESLI